MKNNFNFNASIKMKDLEKMEKVISLLENEKVQNEDTELCIAFRNLLNSFDNTPNVKMADLLEAFINFYGDFLYPYCKRKIQCQWFEEFDFEQVQYVMDKMKEIIYIISGKYGL